jgi:hypothetical protein
MRSTGARADPPAAGRGRLFNQGDLAIAQELARCAGNNARVSMRESYFGGLADTGRACGWDSDSSSARSRSHHSSRCRIPRRGDPERSRDLVRVDA